MLSTVKHAIRFTLCDDDGLSRVTNSSHRHRKLLQEQTTIITIALKIDNDCNYHDNDDDDDNGNMMKILITGKNIAAAADSINLHHVVIKPCIGCCTQRYLPEDHIMHCCPLV